MLELTVASAAFAMGAALPPKFACTGENVSPPLQWSTAPAETKSLAIICDDPDAPSGSFTHWLLFNLPPQTTQVAANLPKSAGLDSGAIQGMTDFGKNGYWGPCPPPGRPHTYVYTVYALDTKLDLVGTATRAQVLKAMEGHVLAKGSVSAKFGR